MKNIKTKKLEKEFECVYKLVISEKSKLIPLEEKRWKEFWLEDISNIVGGRDIYERERIKGQTPYITATANNNGIGYFINNTNKTLQEECISVNRNGSVGYAFYHDYQALYGNDTRKLKPKVKNKYTSLFLTRVIANQKDKYGYGYKMGSARLKRQKIMLPVDEFGNPDYSYMKKYMQIEKTKTQYEILSYYHGIFS